MHTKEVRDAEIAAVARPLEQHDSIRVSVCAADPMPRVIAQVGAESPAQYKSQNQADVTGLDSGYYRIRILKLP